jgi:hypothetical protein
MSTGSFWEQLKSLYQRLEHNDVGSLQGGTTAEYYHATAAENAVLTDLETGSIAVDDIAEKTPGAGIAVAHSLALAAGVGIKGTATSDIGESGTPVGDVYATTLSASGLTMYGAITMGTTNQVYFRDSALYISSKDDGHLDLDADANIDLNINGSEVANWSTAGVTLASGKQFIQTNYNTTNYQARFGAFVIQSYAASDGWFGNNIIWNTNWKYVVTGYGALIHMPNGGFNFYTAPSGTGGDTATCIARFGIDNDGTVKVRGGVLQVDHIAEYTGSHKIVCDDTVELDAGVALLAGGTTCEIGDATAPFGYVHAEYLQAHSHNTPATNRVDIYHDDTDGFVHALVGDLTLKSDYGNIRFGTYAALSGESVAGYVTIKDEAGNARKLAVVS